MKPWEVGLSTGCFYRHTIRRYLREIVDSGFRLLEISSSSHHIDIRDRTGLAAIKGILDDHGVEVFSLHAPFAKQIDITSPDPGERAFSQEYIRQSLEAASVLGARCFVLHPWPEKEFPTHSPEKHERKRHSAQYINALAARSRELGIILALENMQPHLLISPMKDLMWIHRETEEAHVGACFDIGHAFLGNIQSALHELSGHITVVHAHDNYGKKDDHLPPGKGVVDWPWFIREVLDTGFKGPFIIELEDREGADPREVLHGARQGAELIARLVRDFSKSCS